MQGPWGRDAGAPDRLLLERGVSRQRLCPAGDIASDLDTKRKRSVAVIARSLASPLELPPGVVLQGRPSSSKARPPPSP